MATILSLALKVNADASGVVKNLTPAERALENLAKQASKATSAFDVLAKDSQSAADAQAVLNQKFTDLAEQLKGGLSAQQYADQFAALREEVKNTADAYARAAEITKKYTSAEQQRQDSVAELERLLLLGAISEETYGRAVYEGSEAQAKAIAAERERLEVLGQGQRLAEQFATTEERRAQQLADVDRLLKAGAISEETAARARAEFSGQNAAAIQAEKDLAAAAEESAKRRTAAEKEASDFIDKVRGDIEKASALEIAEAEKIRAQAVAAAGRIIEANLTPQERYDRQMQELNTHLQEGRLSQDQFNRAAARAEQDLNGVAKEATVADDRIDNLNKNVSLLAKIEIGRLIVDGLQALGSVFTRVTSEVTSLVSSVNTSVDTLNDFSARTGIGVEALQGYSFAAKLAGVDTEQFLGAVQKLSVSIGKASPGDALDKSLRGINLSLEQLRGLSPEDQFSAIGSAISELPTASDRAAAAVELFGEKGAALAPLFREGITSLKELEAEGEKLGAIVSDVQVGNVADMNDAFDKVRATVQGIVGQVIGNLAPAVTDVTNQFLEFVKTFEGTGTQGTGGNAIANAITDVLLQGAEYFAEIFDKFVANFGSLGETFSFAADVFDVTSKILLAASEGIRAAFNAIQTGIDVLLLGFGKIIEALGSYVSDDLEQFGAGLAAASQESADRNAREMAAAAANAANTFNSIFAGGDGNAQQAGQGAASQYLSGLRSEIENARLPEVKVQADLGDAGERLEAYFKTAEDGGSKLFQQSADTVAQFQKMADEGGLTADQIQIMNGFMDDLNGKLDKENESRQQATENATKQAEADAARVKELMKPSDQSAKLEADIASVAREQLKTQKELAAARERSATEDSNAAAARLAQLDQLRSKLEDQQTAIDQGFSDGFSAAFSKTAESISGLVDKAGEFGNAGAEAAMKLQEGVALAQEQARDGIILSSDVYEKEISRQRSIFEERLAQIEQLKRAEQEAKTAAFQLEVDANQRVNEFIAQRTQAEVAGAEQAAARRQQAAFNIEAIEQRIALERQSLEAAREQNDMNSARAAVQRIDLLKDALAVEQDISNGREKQLQTQQQLIESQQQYENQQQAAVQAYQQQQQQAQQQYAQEQARIFEEQRKAAEAEAKRQEERLRKLNTLGQQSINVADVRSVEGANLVLQTAAQAQDPALIQARLQTKLLERVALGIGQAASNYFNQPVAIVGAARLN
jgi:hypothetical protein